MTSPPPNIDTASLPLPGKEPSSAFVRGAKDSLPVCLTFVFLFFAIGAASNSAGLSSLQAAFMTLMIHAAPLQIFIVQNHTSLAALPLIFAAVVINFRFVIMSSVLAPYFRRQRLWHTLLSIQLLSVSTFTLANSKKDKYGNLHSYFLGCGLSTLATAFIATIAGYHTSSQQSVYLGSLIAMILPLHFTALTGLSWPQVKPAVITASGFIITPVGALLLGDYQIFVVPFILAAIFTLTEKPNTGANP